MRATALVTLALICACSSGNAPRSAPGVTTVAASVEATKIRSQWLKGLDTLRLSLVRLDSALHKSRSHPDRAASADAQARFTDARIAYKRLEFLIAYFDERTTRMLNGPALPRVANDDSVAVAGAAPGEIGEPIFSPEGFQSIEELLFPLRDSAALSTASNNTQNMIDMLGRLQQVAQIAPISDDRIFDAARLEIARVVTLGIAGFDSPVAKGSLEESAASLAGVRDMLAAYRNRLGESSWAVLDSAFERANGALRSSNDFDAFDRLQFIVGAANPLAQRIASARDQLGIGVPSGERAFRAKAMTVFESGAFDPEGFAPPGTDTASAARVALGRELFFDAALSGDGKRSCASCHDPHRAFTEGVARSSTRSGHRVLRNAPTILNSGLQLGAFYDQRARYLEDQVADVVGNPNEMGGNLDLTARKLERDAKYNHLFAAAFGSGDDSVMDARHLRQAVAAYMRSLQTLNTPVDRALRGDTTALNREERQGFNLFMGRGRCATCHFLPLTNGTAPPTYRESEVEVLGVPDRAVVQHARIDPDSGRFRQTRMSLHMHAFKVPTLRNIALTAPYMHNGVYRTLEEVVDFYNRGGGAGIGINLPNQTLPRDSLGLSSAEQKALVAFLRALTDTTGTIPP